MEKRLKGYMGACLYIFEHYGQSAQYKKLIEEMAEFTKAICTGNPDNFIEELADVSVLLDQITAAFPEIGIKVEAIKKEKVERTIRGILEEQDQYREIGPSNYEKLCKRKFNGEFIYE